MSQRSYQTLVSCVAEISDHILLSWRSRRPFSANISESLSLDPDSNRDQHKKNRERFLKLRPRQALSQSSSEPCPEEKSERDPEGRGDVEMPAPVVLPGAKRAHGEQQRSERSPRRHLGLKLCQKDQRRPDHDSAADAEHPGKNSCSKTNGDKENHSFSSLMRLMVCPFIRLEFPS